MAYAKFGAILTRLRQVIEQSAGTLREVPSARFAGDLPDGLSDNALGQRAITKPRVEASIAGMRPSHASPPDSGSLHILDVDFEVRVVRLLSPLEHVSDADRDALRALAYEDADVLRQALRFGGNLSVKRAQIDGHGATFPIADLDGFDFSVTVDGVLVAVFFTTETTAAEVAATVNAEAAGAGLSNDIAYVNADGQLRIQSSSGLASGSVTIGVSSAASLLGFTAGDTDSGEATDLASGALLWQRTRVLVRKTIDEGAQPIETIHTFLGRVISRPATS